MLRVKADAMLVIINIRGKLHKPRGVVYSDRNNSVISPRRMVKPTLITFVFGAKLTFGIA